MSEFDFKQHNRSAWNRLAKEGNRFAQPAKESDYENPLASVDGPGWLGGDIFGKRVLCLAAGGGRQGPLYAAAGAVVTVVDISDQMLNIDQQICRRKGLTMQAIEASMDDLSMLATGSFDIVIQPVSSCYVPDLPAVYEEVARVTAEGGLYISQHKQPASLQTSLDANRNGRYVVLHEPVQNRPLPEPEQTSLIRERGTCEYIHSWQSLVGELCRSGFVVEDLIEPDHADVGAEPGSFGHRGRFVNPYVRIKARRNSSTARSTKSLWTPEVI